MKKLVSSQLEREEDKEEEEESDDKEEYAAEPVVEKHQYPEEAAEGSDNRVSCNVCERKFAPDRISKH